MLTEFHIGIDDTDSKLGGCTTYTASLIFEQILREKLGPADFPWLVRLNPNIPWKTRGNGALAIHLRTAEDSLDEVKRLTLKIVEETSDPSIPATDPAVVFLRGKIPDQLGDFTTKTLHDVIRVKDALRLIKKVGGESHTYGGQRGVIGALAAIGYGSDRDHTYEVIAYRSKHWIGKSRQVDSDSVRRMAFDRLDAMFNSVDPETGKVLICPHGPDPVLFGIRGEDPSELLEALSEVKVLEPIERVMLFKTNQGTDSHLKHKTDIARMRAHQSATLTGTVATPPIVIRGGHAIFKLCDDTGLVECAAYKPTGSLKDSVLQLIPGDQIIASGGVRGRRAGMTLNLEKLEVLQLTKGWSTLRPHCSRCGSSCESMGKGQGFRCRKCGAREDRAPPRVGGFRALDVGVYVPPPRANRHLTKPKSRYLVPATRPAKDGEKENSSFIGPSFDELLHFTESLA